MMKKLFFSSLFVFYSYLGSSQDLILNNYDLAPKQLNPALNGSACGIRVATNMQKSIGTSTKYAEFLAYSASVDAPILLKKQWRVGVGYGYLSDVVEASQYGVKSHMLASSIMKTISIDNVAHRFSLGLEGGLSNRRLNGKNLKWPSQIGPNGFDPSLPTNEDPALDFDFIYKDINLGLDYEAKWQNDDVVNFGIVFNHINNPNVSFLGSQVALKTRAVYYLRTKYMLSPKFGFAPMLYYTSMGNQNTYFGRLGAEYAFDENKTIGTLTAGYQKNNIAFIGAQIRHRDLSFGINTTFGDDSIFRKIETYISYTFGSYACN
jgi:hypothetical protein